MISGKEYSVSSVCNTITKELLAVVKMCTYAVVSLILKLNKWITDFDM